MSIQHAYVVAGLPSLRVVALCWLAFPWLSASAKAQNLPFYPPTAEEVEPIYIDQSLQHWERPYEQDPYLPAAEGQAMEEYLLEDQYLEGPARSSMPPGTRPGVFQKANVMASWMPNWGGHDGYGIAQMGANLVFGFPFPERESPLLITPDYTLNFLDGPSYLPVPSRLHEASVDFNHFRAINDQWTFNAAITIGSYADDDRFADSDSFQASGRALGIYQADPLTKWIFGVVYVNRANASVLPAIGYIHATEDVSIELVFPRPRYAWRTSYNGPPGHDERWCFVQGEFGGGIWAIERPNGVDDKLSYSDLRLLIGTERKVIGGVSHRWEVGYVFNRELEFDRGGGTFDVDPAMFVRTGWTY
jgi:hypothetical protein